MGLNTTYTCDMCKKTESVPYNFIITSISGRYACVDDEVNNTHGYLVDKEIYLCINCYHKFINEINDRF